MSVANFISSALIEVFDNLNLSFMKKKDDAGFIWTKIRISCTTFRGAEIAQSV
jgi:hypothetical protein